MKFAVIISLSLTLLTPSVLAKVSVQDADRLGRDLTPMGAQRSANADGSIPEWTGGLAQKDIDPDKGYDNPFAADKPLFTITSSNYLQYKDRLTAGQLDTFRRYKTYSMKVYPSRRSASYPKGVYEALKKNALRAELVGTDSLRNAVTGPAFPMPKSGAEAMWNHKTKYVAPSLEGYYNAAVVTRGGDFEITRVLRYAKLHYNRIGIEPADLQDNIFLHYLTYVLSPTRLAGNIVLVHQTIDQLREPNMAWSYNPGQRRVRRAPELGYDNPTLATDSLGTHDQIDVYNGALDRYDWKLQGRREIYIPYNSYRLEERGLSPKQVIAPAHINQDLARYELHRVWVVDATLREGTNHVYKRRTFYLDEDSWYISYVDCYDRRDELWRVQESHLMTAYDLPAVVAAVELGYDFANGRYVVAGLDNMEKPTNYRWAAEDGFFTPAAMRRSGLR